MKTILLVEDDKNQLLLYKQELSLEGYNIITAQDGRGSFKEGNRRITRSDRNGYQYAQNERDRVDWQDIKRTQKDTDYY